MIDREIDGNVFEWFASVVVSSKRRRSRKSEHGEHGERGERGERGEPGERSEHGKKAKMLHGKSVKYVNANANFTTNCA